MTTPGASAELRAVCPAQRLDRPTERHTLTGGVMEGRYVWMTCSCGEQWWQVTREATT